MSKNYDSYDSYLNGPPYKIVEEQIYELLIEDAFKKDVKETFNYTLELNSSGDNEKSDSTFGYLANILALLCHAKGYGDYTLDDFVQLADEEKIDKISILKKEELENLLTLLDKLSVFKKNGSENEGYTYRFNRFSLFKLMGKTEDEIRENLKELKDRER